MMKKGKEPTGSLEEPSWRASSTSVATLMVQQLEGFLILSLHDYIADQLLEFVG